MRRHHNAQPTKKIRAVLAKEKKLDLPPSPLKGRCLEKGELVFLLQRPYTVKFVNPAGTEIRLGLVPEELRAMADEAMKKVEDLYQEDVKKAAREALLDKQVQKAEEKIANKRPRRKAPRLVIDGADGGVIDGLPGIPLPVHRVRRGTRVEPDKVG